MRNNFWIPGATNSITQPNFPDCGIWECNLCNNWSINPPSSWLNGGCICGGIFAPYKPRKHKKKRKKKNV